MADLGQNILALITCRQNEHCLFRSFGLGGAVDEPNTMTRNRIQVEVNKWFPSTIVQSVTVEKANINGEFTYNIQVKGL